MDELPSVLNYFRAYLLEMIPSQGAVPESLYTYEVSVELPSTLEFWRSYLGKA